ncbi:hypothetical protein HanXRQr2_Chr03g0122961 [Helianthus annuus]|uniref:Uncharacterized protein n=1 Tax=Helianthus annuus TaxID=4232 RepID=A0A9K3JJ31_HELAN|nr:hypothetical protein HanXRQr2_Chr03g0122961 [Helianthus annuus]KAJ0944691.1 hypothetical protein HanPSC8_Chr03g0119671 [Helianthus annuus]
MMFSRRRVPLTPSTILQQTSHMDTSTKSNSGAQFHALAYLTTVSYVSMFSELSAKHLSCQNALVRSSRKGCKRSRWLLSRVSSRLEIKSDVTKWTSMAGFGSPRTAWSSLCIHGSILFSNISLLQFLPINP